MAPEPRSIRWARIRSERREQILAAASRVLGREGPAKTSMLMIAEECDATKVTIYAHFRSKDLLVARVLERWMEETARALGAIEGGSHDPERLLWRVAAGLEQVTRSASYRGLARAMSEAAEVPELVRAHWNTRFNRLRHTLTRAFSLQRPLDAAAQAEAFLTLLGRTGAAPDAGAIVRLFLASHLSTREAGTPAASTSGSTEGCAGLT